MPSNRQHEVRTSVQVAVKVAGRATHCSCCSFCAVDVSTAAVVPALAGKQDLERQCTVRLSRSKHPTSGRNRKDRVHMHANDHASLSP